MSTENELRKTKCWMSWKSIYFIKNRLYYDPTSSWRKYEKWKRLANMKWKWLVRLTIEEKVQRKLGKWTANRRCWTFIVHCSVKFCKKPIFSVYFVFFCAFPIQVVIELVTLVDVQFCWNKQRILHYKVHLVQVLRKDDLASNILPSAEGILNPNDALNRHKCRLLFLSMKISHLIFTGHCFSKRVIFSFETLWPWL